MKKETVEVVCSNWGSTAMSVNRMERDVDAMNDRAAAMTSLLNQNKELLRAWLDIAVKLGCERELVHTAHELRLAHMLPSEFPPESS